MEITKRTVAYHPTSDWTGIAVIVDPARGTVRTMDVWATSQGDGDCYWYAARAAIA